MHASCSICGDIFTGVDDEVLHSTPCGHIFHYACLLEWLRRVPTCPHCRSKVDERKTIKLYFHKNDYPVEDSSTLCHQVQSLQFNLKMKDVELKNTKEDADKAKAQAKELRTTLIERENEIRTHTTIVQNFEDRIRALKTQVKRNSEAQLQVEELQKLVKQYESLEKILKGSIADASNALEDMKKDVSDPTVLSSCITVLKKEVSHHKANYKHLQRVLQSEEMKLKNATAEILKLEKKISILNRSLDKVKEDLSHTENENENLKKKCKYLEEAIMPTDSDSNNSNPRDKALKRLINEYPVPNVKKNYTSSIDLDVTSVSDSSGKVAETGISPISPVRLYEVKPRSMLNSKRLLTSKQTYIPKVQCYDGLGGHVNEEVTRTDRSVLLSLVKNKTNKLLPPPKRPKASTSTVKQQSDLLNFVRKM